MKAKLIFILLIYTVASYGITPTKLVEAPTAGILRKQTAKVNSMLFSNGGMLLGLDVGIFSRMSIGFSYGGMNIIGEEKIHWNKRVELSLNVRLLEEDYSRPAILIGYQTQGFGQYIESLDRYEIKSKGFFGVLSKNYALYGNLGFHVGANYSLEKKDDEDINFFVGIDKDITKNFYFSLEYDLGINDDEKEALGKGRGFLNLKAAYLILDSIEIEFLLMDLLENYQLRTSPVRSLRVNYFFQY